MPPPQPSFVCKCGFPLCVCDVSTPVKPPATGWLPPTPASSAKKPAVAMWMPVETSPPPATTPITMATVYTTTGFQISTPGKSSAAAWLPATPAASARKPSVTMPGWTAPTTSTSPSLSTRARTTSSSIDVATAISMSPILAKPEVKVERDPHRTGSTINLPEALEMLADLDTALDEKEKALDIISTQHKADMTALRKHHEADFAAMQSNLDSALAKAFAEKDEAMDVISAQQAELTLMQRKFSAMHFHCVNLSQELQKKGEKLDLLKESDRLQKQLSQQQQLLARSTVALYKQHKTRFIMGQHSIVYRPTDTSPVVQQEMTLAAARIRKAKQEQERADHNKLSAAVDRLAKKYDRYNLISTTNIHNTRCATDGLPCIVPRDMMGIWLFADTDIEPSVEEQAMYEFHLQKEVRGPPIYSPTLPRPTVNWTNLNKHRRKNLPDPELFPIHSAPEDPTYYTNLAMYKPEDQHNYLWTPKECGCVKCLPHFGHRYGLMTDMGVIAMPDSAVHGYRWDDYTGGWVIATGC